MAFIIYIFLIWFNIKIIYGILIYFFYESCLSLACLSGNLKLVEFLLSQDDVKINPKDIFYLIFNTKILTNACSSGKKILVKYLIETYKLNPKQRDIFNLMNM